MTITISQLLTKAAIDLQETIAFTSGLWSATEMIGYVNYAQVDFLRRTGILKTDDLLYVGGMFSVTDLVFFGWAEFFASGSPSPGPPGTVVIAFNKPSDSMDIERISFNTKMLYRATSWDLNRENPNWKNQPAGNPRYYHEDNIDVGLFEVDRMPSSGAGSFRVFSDLLPPVCLSLSDTLTVPDAWEQYIRWLVLSLALGKDGDGQDLARAKYAQSRYLFGVNLALRLMSGDLNSPVEAVANAK